MENRYTKQYLDSLSVIALQSLHIQNKAEEDMIQEVLDVKRAHLPPENPVVLPTTETDAITTPEQEAQVQAALNEKRGISDEVPEATHTREEMVAELGEDAVKKIEDEAVPVEQVEVVEETPAPEPTPVVEETPVPTKKPGRTAKVKE